MSGIRESLFRRVLFPLYESGLRRRRTLEYLREYEVSQWLDGEQIAALQWNRLKRLIEHCWREVPYYRRCWTAIGATPEDIRTLDDYARLPLLTKADIRANFQDLHAASWAGNMLYKATGGSTGEPLRFGYTRESYERRMAMMWRGYAWAGARMGRRTLYLWGGAVGRVPRLQAIKDRLYHAAFARRMLDSFRMSEANLAEHARAIDRYRPEIVVAYVTPLVRLAEWMLAEGHRPHRPSAILTGAEALTHTQREILQQAFDAPVFNTYGCREFMLIAAECEHRHGLHVNAEQLLVETVGADAHASGDVVITDLHNFGMPFLRYRNGDLATMDTRTCTCGRGLPMLRSIDGRKLDMLQGPDGRLLPGEFFPHLMKEFSGVVRYQVVQRSLDALELAIVRGPGFEDGALERIRAEVAAVLGAQARLDIHLVDRIATPANGKFRVTINAIDRTGAGS